MVISTDLYTFMPLSVTLIEFQANEGRSCVGKMKLKNVFSWNLWLYGTVEFKDGMIVTRVDMTINIMLQWRETIILAYIAALATTTTTLNVGVFSVGAKLGSLNICMMMITSACSYWFQLPWFIWRSHESLKSIAVVKVVCSSTPHKSWNGDAAFV